MKFPKIKKSWIIEAIIFILFTIFLISLIPEPQEVEQEKLIEYGQNSRETLDVKFDVVSREVGEEFEKSKIGYINNKYLSNLIVNKKISNRENTIAQEIVTMYKKNLTQEALNLSLELIEPILDSFDSPKERKWFNYEFSFKGNNESFVFYNQKQLLKEFNESQTKGEYSFIVKPYIFERYEFTLANDTIEVVDINLFTFEGEEKLSEYIDINTYEAKKEFKDLSSKFIESDNEYVFSFKIWN